MGNPMEVRVTHECFPVEFSRQAGVLLCWIPGWETPENGEKDSKKIEVISYSQVNGDL